MRHHLTLLTLSLSFIGAVGCGAQPAPPQAPAQARCGDSACADSEDAMSCPQDCAPQTCLPPMCPKESCGDGVCQPQEDPMGCPQDCNAQPIARCGDGACDPNEDTTSCPQDCGACQIACQGASLLYCDEQGQQARVECPSSLGSSCQEQAGVISCGCGPLTTGQAACLDRAQEGADLAACEDGSIQLYLCPEGTRCQDDGCVCDDADDGVCPDPICTQDPDCSSCTPMCEGRVCGDNKCQGSCGSCAAGSRCDAQGQCVTTCTPKCQGKVCGDNGCGGVCGACGQDQSCDAQGQCQDPAPRADAASFKSSVQSGTSAAYSFSEQDPGTFFSCAVDMTANTMSIELSNGQGLVRMVIEDDPIGFCLFNTAAFNTFTYQRFSQGQLDKSYGKDSLGQSTGLTLSCQLSNGRLSGTFSAARLFEGRNSSVFPRYASITEGSFDCAL